MKSKQLLLIVLILAALIAAWMVVLGSDKSEEQAALQAELVEKADVFAGKELYVRAIPLYSEALSYSTDQNDAIYERLLDCYLSSGDDDSFVSLVENRVSKKKADADTCLRAAEILVSYDDFKEAETLLIDAYDYLDGEEAEKIREYYETFRYSYSMRVTDFDAIITCGNQSILPARNGTKYCYISPSGYDLFKATYDSVTRFNNNGVAVVKNDGKYYAINTDGVKYSIDETGVEAVSDLTDNYIIAQKDGKYGFYDIDFNPVAEDLKFDRIIVGGVGNWAVQSGEKWAFLDPSGTDLTGPKFDDVAQNSEYNAFVYMTVTKDGKSVTSPVAAVKESGRWYLVDETGAHITENSFDCAAAPESDGYIAVLGENRKWGFINTDGELVIDYKFHSAESFSDNLAAVRVDESGKWGYINRAGDVVIEAKFDWAAPFKNGMAIAGYNGKTAILELELYSE